MAPLFFSSARTVSGQSERSSARSAVAIPLSCAVAALVALGYRPGTLRTLRSQAGGVDRMTLRGLTVTFLD